MKLEDPDYIAKYVREKYFYSKEGEVILRIED
jgi:cell division protein FtsB